MYCWNWVEVDDDWEAGSSSYSEECSDTNEFGDGWDDDDLPDEGGGSDTEADTFRASKAKNSKESGNPNKRLPLHSNLYKLYDTEERLSKKDTAGTEAVWKSLNRNIKALTKKNDEGMLPLHIVMFSLWRAYQKTEVKIDYINIIKKMLLHQPEEQIMSKIMEIPPTFSRFTNISEDGIYPLHVMLAIMNGPTNMNDQDFAEAWLDVVNLLLDHQLDTQANAMCGNGNLPVQAVLHSISHIIRKKHTFNSTIARFLALVRRLLEPLPDRLLTTKSVEETVILHEIIGSLLETQFSWTSDVPLACVVPHLEVLDVLIPRLPSGELLMAVDKSLPMHRIMQCLIGLICASSNLSEEVDAAITAYRRTIRVILQQFPKKQLTTRNGRNNLVFHEVLWSLQAKCPWPPSVRRKYVSLHVELIEELLQRSTPKQIMAKDCKGSLPIHAVMSAFQSSVIESSTDLDVETIVPLYLNTFGLLLEHSPEQQLMAKDEAKNTLLHGFIGLFPPSQNGQVANISPATVFQCGSMVLKTFEALLKIAPEQQVTTRNALNEFPLQQVVEGLLMISRWPPMADLQTIETIVPLYLKLIQMLIEPQAEWLVMEKNRNSSIPSLVVMEAFNQVAGNFSTKTCLSSAGDFADPYIHILKALFAYRAEKQIAANFLVHNAIKGFRACEEAFPTIRSYVKLINCLLQYNSAYRVSKDARGNLPIHCLLLSSSGDRNRDGRTEVLKLLLESRRDIQLHSMSGKGRTLMQLACLLGVPSTVQMLLKLNPEQVMKEDRQQNLPLHLLVVHHPERGFTQFEKKVSSRSLNLGQNVMNSVYTDIQGIGEYSEARGEIVSYLLEYAPFQQVLRKNRSGMMPIHLMSLWALGFMKTPCDSSQMAEEEESRRADSYCRAMKAVLSHKPQAQTFCKDAKNWPAHLILAQLCAYQTASKGISYSAYCNFIHSGLRAVMESYPDKQVTTPNSQGIWPIHLACSADSSIAVQRLLVHHPQKQVVARDGAGRLPIHIACAREAVELGKLLLSYDPTSQLSRSVCPRKGMTTPLHVACKIGSLELVLELLSHNVDGQVRQPDTRKKVPIEIAIQYRHAEIALAVLRHAPEQFAALEPTFVELIEDNTWFDETAKFFADGILDWPTAPAKLEEAVIEIRAKRRTIKSARSSLGKRDRTQACLP